MILKTKGTVKCMDHLIVSSFSTCLNCSIRVCIVDTETRFGWLVETELQV